MLVRDGGPDQRRGAGIVVARQARHRVAGGDRLRREVHGREAGVAQRAEAQLQRMHLGVELREPLGDRQRLAVGARGVDDQLRGVAIERLERGLARGRGTRERARQVAEKAVAGVTQAGHGVVLHVARHDHRLAGVPGAEQRGGEVEGVLGEQRPARAGARGEQVAPRADLAREVRCRQRFARSPGHRGRRGGAGQRGQRPPAGRVSHAPLRRRRCARARAGAPATRRPSAGPSRCTTAARCTAPRRPRWPTAPWPRR